MNSDSQLRNTLALHTIVDSRLATIKAQFNEWKEKNAQYIESAECSADLAELAHVSACALYAWNPIESAPKGRVSFDVWVSSGWRIPDCMFIEGELCRFSSDDECYISDDDLSGATHWMIVNYSTIHFELLKPSLIKSGNETFEDWLAQFDSAEFESLTPIMAAQAAFYDACLVNGWAPISTSPREGEEFDVWLSFGTRVPHCKWVEGKLHSFNFKRGEFMPQDDLDYATHWHPCPIKP